MFLAIGADVSVNHSALVALNTRSECVGVRYLHTKVKAINKKLGGTRCPVKVTRHKTRDDYDIERLVFLREYYDDITEWICELAHEHDALDVYIGLEAYAYSAGRQVIELKPGKKAMVGGGSKPYQIGEAGGLFKTAVKQIGYKLRLHDPTSVKMFATNNGSASKEQVQEAQLPRMMTDGLDLAKYPDEEDVIGDIVDAHVLARMVWAEVTVRSGERTMKQLEAGERRVFIRATKTNPVNVLDRDWL